MNTQHTTIQETVPPPPISPQVDASILYVIRRASLFLANFIRPFYASNNGKHDLSLPSVIPVKVHHAILGKHKSILVKI